jgi:hypothetical protein
MMITLMLPSHVTTIPRYIMFRNFGWINTFLPIIVPKFFATDAFFIFLLVQFIRGLPRDIDESALIDGCSKFGIYTRIIMPLTVAALSHQPESVYRPDGTQVVFGLLGHVFVGADVCHVGALADPGIHAVFLSAEVLRPGYRYYWNQGIGKVPYI